MGERPREPILADVALAVLGLTIGTSAAYNGNPVVALICGALMWAAARRLWWRWRART